VPMQVLRPCRRASRCHSIRHGRFGMEPFRSTLWLLRPALHRCWCITVCACARPPARSASRVRRST
jgi:hypothetical protein